MAVPNHPRHRLSRVGNRLKRRLSDIVYRALLTDADADVTAEHPAEAPTARAA